MYDIHAPISAGRSKDPLVDAFTDPHAPLNLGVDLEVYAGDWHVPPMLRSTFAMISGGHLEGDAVCTPGGGSRSDGPSDDVTAQAIRLFPTPPTISLDLDPVPVVVARRDTRVTQFRGLEVESTGAALDS